MRRQLHRDPPDLSRGLREALRREVDNGRFAYALRLGGKESGRGDEMGILERYQSYADAFEQSYVDDDLSRIEPFFTEDAVYEGDPEDARGRDAVLAKLKGGVDGFDRRMDSRSPDFQTPTVEGDTLVMKWTVSYTKAGLPDLVISGVETAVFEGDRISRLRDDFDPEAQKAMGEWMAAHGSALAGG